MSYGNQHSRYLENDVLSRPKEWLVPLLYEHLLASLRRATVQIEIGDVEGRTASLSKASSIVLELISSLDLERGGDFAAGLSALYGFIAGELLTIGRTRDTRQLGKIIAIISELHEAWVQAAEAVSPRARSTGSAALPAA